MIPFVVLAGGEGTRIREITQGRIPKALIPINSVPFLEYKIQSLEKMGATHIWLLVGRGSSQIDYFLSERVKSSAEICTVHDGDHLLGTGGAIKAAASLLPPKFWVTYADSLVFADLDLVTKSARSLGLQNSMTVIKYSSGLENPNVAVRHSKVVRYAKGSDDKALTHIDYGLLQLEASSFTDSALGQQFDLGIVIANLASKKRLHAFEVQQRYWEIGTPSALAETSLFLSEQD